MSLTATETLARATASSKESIGCPASLLVFAHPDDETIALGGRLERFGEAHLVHLTDGAPRDQQDSRAHGFSSLGAYRSARRAELDGALAAAGVASLSRECLDVPDQESALALVWLTRLLAERFHRHRPEVVFTHPYEGGHPDHDACAFAVHHAVALLRSQGANVPLILEAPFYHAGPCGMETGTFLPASPPAEEKVYFLSPEEQQRKQALLDCFTSQRNTLSIFPAREERYRIAPEYDFCKPPHPGPAFYDDWPWGMNSQGFCRLAAAAEAVLDEERQVACR